MKLPPLRRSIIGVVKAPRRTHQRTVCGGFTLAEVLAALVFMAIVIPVAIEGLRVANAAGQAGLRKNSATRIAEQVLNEWIIAGQSQTANQRGTVREGALEYRWTIKTEPWNQDTMRVATAEVIYAIQGRELDARVSTLIDNSTQ